MSTEENILYFDDPQQWSRLQYIYQPNEPFESVQIHDFLEYLDGQERITFFNALYDVIQPKTKIHVTVPYYTHVQSLANWALKWPPISEHSFLFLSRAWRNDRPYTTKLGYTCDFDLYSHEFDMVDEWTTRNDIARQFAIKHYLNVVPKLFITLIRLEVGV